MGPKIEAAIRFLEGGGKRAIIAHLEEAVPALAARPAPMSSPTTLKLAGRRGSARRGSVRSPTMPACGSKRRPAAFERSFYVSFGSQWICIGIQALGAGPLNILCAPSGDGISPAAMLRVGGAATIRDDALVTGGATIMLGGAGCWIPERPKAWSERSLSHGLAVLADALPQALPEQGLARLLRPDAATPSCPVT